MGFFKVKKESAFDPFNAAALKALEKENNKRPLPPPRKETIKKDDSAESLSAIGSRPVAPAATSKLARPPPSRGSKNSIKGVSDLPGSDEFLARTRDDSNPPGRPPPSTP